MAALARSLSSAFFLFFFFSTVFFPRDFDRKLCFKLEIQKENRFDSDTDWQKSEAEKKKERKRERERFAHKAVARAAIGRRR